MTRISKGRRILLQSTRLHWQLIVSGIATAALIPILSGNRFDKLIEELRSPSTYVTVLGVIGGILALASSIAYAHLLQFMSASNAAKSGAYHRLQERLYEMDEFVQANGPDTEVSDALLEFTYDLRRLQLRDYPIQDWGERLNPFESFLTTKSDDGFEMFWAHLLVRLNYIEELMGLIGISSVRQILLSVIAAPLLKCFGALAAIMLSSAIGILMSSYESAGVALVLLPVFFAVFSAFLFVEVAHAVYRETEEIVDFTKEDDVDGMLAGE
jgi:ABC-type multidrug transport system fused ATPase/permease subunit